MSVISYDVPVCPLCGSPAVLIDYDDSDMGKIYTVICTNIEHCGLGSGLQKTTEIALNAWNDKKEYAEKIKRERAEKA